MERVNKKVNRYLRSFVFETLEMNQNNLYLPFVQRIMKSSVHVGEGALALALLVSFLPTSGGTADAGNEYTVSGLP